jgi:hypothetical protein
MTEHYATLTVRFEEQDDDFDPDDPGDTACARTDTSRGFSIAHRDDLIEKDNQASRMTIGITSSMPHKEPSHQLLYGGLMSNQISTTVDADFGDIDEGVPFSEGSWCREYIRSICWYPSPTEWPKLHPPVDDWGTVDVQLKDGTLVIDPDGSFAEHLAEETEQLNEDNQEGDEEKSLPLSVSASHISIEWPEDIKRFIYNQWYLVAITDSIKIPDGKEPPHLFCDGPFFTDDTEDNPFLKDGPGIIATGKHGTRVGVIHALTGDNISDTTLDDGFVRISGSMSEEVTTNAPTFSVSVDDLQKAINEPGEYALRIKTKYLYGRIEFQAFGRCLKSQSEYCKDNNDDCDYIKTCLRPEGLEEGVNFIPPSMCSAKQVADQGVSMQRGGGTFGLGLGGDGGIKTYLKLNVYVPKYVIIFYNNNEKPGGWHTVSINGNELGSTKKANDAADFAAIVLATHDDYPETLLPSNATIKETKQITTDIFKPKGENEITLTFIKGSEGFEYDMDIYMNKGSSYSRMLSKNLDSKDKDYTFTF